MQNNLVKIDIVDDESLLRACDILHDGHCDISTVKYDEQNGTLRVIFDREFFEEPAMMIFEPKYFFLHKVSFPIVRSELLLDEIRTYKIENKSNIQFYSFNECRIKKPVYKFLFNEDMEFDLSFKDKPKGSLVDQKILDKQGSFYKFKNPFKNI